jgi:hypothetical protein
VDTYIQSKASAILNKKGLSKINNEESLNIKVRKASFTVDDLSPMGYSRDRAISHTFNHKLDSLA